MLFALQSIKTIFCYSFKI